ncbi:nascent polypeptide-associated complex subunit alpha, muscle-specific form-like [Amphibalanus amphitrite]|uniref:nascent polypeptide-associated complex subunit alpha, muscle-specific form-like n=1 Tax=Amphibalanus amphitrite TaxID=1232801 RepID=UPI001C92B01D|nr:nascent polypeptide-associated complex subunit alpha, muscle-specific form-like [Amphibalanus amphitrite]
MSGCDDWGALPVTVAPLWRPPQPAARDEDGQFSDAAGSEDEEDPAEGAACSLQTVVAAPAAAVPRLALSEMVAAPQPVPAGGGDWEVPPLPGRLSELSLDDSGADRPGGAASADVSPRSVAGTASVSLRSYLDPAAVAADLTADMTDCETLDQLAELVDTGRTVRPAPSASPTGSISPETAGAASRPAGDTAEHTGQPTSQTVNFTASHTANFTASQPASHTAPYSSQSASHTANFTANPAASHSTSRVTAWGDQASQPDSQSQEPSARCAGTYGYLPTLPARSPADGRGLTAGQDAVISVTSGVTLQRPLQEGEVRTEVVTAGGLTMLKESCRGGTVTSFMMTEKVTQSVRGVGGVEGGIVLQSGEQAARGDGEHRQSLAAGPVMERGGGDLDGAHSANVTSADGTRTAVTAPDRGAPAPLPPAAPPPAVVVSPAPPAPSVQPGPPAESSDSGRGDSAPPAAGAGPAPPCPVHGSPSRRRAFKRSPARRLSFTLESPSPLLVEYYMKHPEERLKVLESAAAVDPDVLELSGTAPVEPESPEPPARPAADPADGDPQAPHSAETGGDRPRRRWADDAASAADLRAALAGRRASEDTVLSSPRPEEPPAPAPAARARIPDIPLGWGSVLRNLSATEEGGAPPPHHHQHQSAAPPARWRVSAPPPPPATLEMSPRQAAGSPSGRRRRVRGSPRPRRAPPALSPLALSRRPTPNFDSHAVQEIVQDRSPGADVGWATPSPPPRGPIRRSPAAPAPAAAAQDRLTATGAADPAAAAAELQDVFRLPALDELRQLLSLHERQMAALVEQQRRQRRALEAACRRREDAVLQRLRRQLAAAELLAAPPADSQPPSPPVEAPMAGGDGPSTSPAAAGWRRAPRPDPRPESGQLTYRCEPHSPPATRQSESDQPSAYERYEAQPSTPPARERPPRPASDPVPTPVARRLAASPGLAEHPVCVPPEALAPGMEARYARVTAAARGFLTRRLMRTEKVQSLIAAVKESMVCALRLQREVDLTKQITKQDLELHERLFNQVRGACYSLHQLCIASTPQQRLAVIAADRAARAHAAERRRSGDAALRLSHATLVSQQRRKYREPMSGRPGSAVPRLRARPSSGAVSVSPKTRSSPSGRPRRVVAHSPRSASRSSLASERTAAAGRASRSARSLVQLANIYAPNPVRRAKSSQSQLTSGGYGGAPQTAEPKRRQRSGRAWR